MLVRKRAGGAVGKVVRLAFAALVLVGAGVGCGSSKAQDSTPAKAADTTDAAVGAFMNSMRAGKLATQPPDLCALLTPADLARFLGTSRVATDGFESTQNRPERACTEYPKGSGVASLTVFVSTDAAERAAYRSKVAAGQHPTPASTAARRYESSPPLTGTDVNLDVPGVEAASVGEAVTHREGGKAVWISREAKFHTAHAVVSLSYRVDAKLGVAGASQQEQDLMSLLARRALEQYPSLGAG